MWNPSSSSSGNAPAGCTDRRRAALRTAAVVTALLAAAAPDRAGGVRVRAGADPREAAVGDPVRLTLEVALPVGLVLETPPVEKTIGPFEILSFEAARPEAKEDGAEQTLTFTLAAFDVGVATVPALTLRARSADGAVREFRTPEVPVVIKSVLGPDSRDIRDIKGVVRVPPRWGPALTAAALLALLGAGVVAWRRRGRRAAVPAAPPRPPHEVALEELDRLASDLDGPSKIFYTRLSGVLRVYLETRFRVPALDLTTAEIVQAMRRADVAADHARRAREVLEASDLAKFAKWEVPAAGRETDIAAARAFVRETAPPPAESAAPGAAA